MNTRTLSQFLRILAVLVIAAGLVAAQVQENPAEPVEETRPGGAAPQGLNDPPPDGYQVAYMFTGVTDNRINTATVVHCSNFGEAEARLYVEFFDVDGNTPGNVYTATTIIPVNESRTFSSSHTDLYVDHATAGLSNDELNQGAGRVLAPITNTHFICTAQMIHSLSTPPEFAVRLPLFTPLGERNYLPVVFK